MKKKAVGCEGKTGGSMNVSSSPLTVNYFCNCEKKKVIFIAL